MCECILRSFSIFSTSLPRFRADLYFANSLCVCPGKVIWVYSGYQGQHIQQILKLLSSPQQPFVVLLTVCWVEQEETGCSGQCSTAQLFVSSCQPALSLHCSLGGVSLMDYLPILSQHSKQHLEKYQLCTVLSGTE